jgi:hypothetical protein
MCGRIDLTRVNRTQVRQAARPLKSAAGLLAHRNQTPVRQAARSPPNMDRRFFARDHRCIVGVAADERRDLNAGNSHERVQVLPPESAFASAHGSIAAPSTKNHQAYPLISKRITIHCCCGSFVTLPRLKDPVTGPQPFLPVRLGLPFGRLSYQSSPSPQPTTPPAGCNAIEVIWAKNQDGLPGKTTTRVPTCTRP